MRAKILTFLLFFVFINFSFAQGLPSEINRATLENSHNDIGIPICGTIFLNDEIAKPMMKVKVMNMMKSSLIWFVPLLFLSPEKRTRCQKQDKK